MSRPRRAARRRAARRARAAASAVGPRPRPADADASRRAGRLAGRDRARRRGGLVHARPVRQRRRPGAAPTASDRDSPRRHAGSRCRCSTPSRRSRDRERHHDSRPALRPLPPGRHATWWISGPAVRCGSDHEAGAAGACGRRRPASRSRDRPPAQQGIEGQVGRFYEDDGWTVYRLGVESAAGRPDRDHVPRRLLPPRRRGARAALGGAGPRRHGLPGRGAGPVSRRRHRRGHGLARTRSRSPARGARGRPALGYELVPASFLRVGARGPLAARSRSTGATGFEFAAGLSISLGGGRKAPAAAAGAPMPRTAVERRGAADGHDLAGVDAAGGHSARLADSVIATATDVMGRPYRVRRDRRGRRRVRLLGADPVRLRPARRHAAAHAARSRRARAGRCSKDPRRSCPGDLLTFSNRGGPVTHVGLYIGDGRFIHSATRGVQVSVLSEDDPYGRWWYKRWVGVRRIVE